MVSFLSIHDTKETQIAKTHEETIIGRSHSIDINIDLYSAGWFDGSQGYSPELPHFEDYWSGYQIGYREYCCGLLGVEIPISEALPKPIASSIAA